MKKHLAIVLSILLCTHPLPSIAEETPLNSSSTADTPPPIAADTTAVNSTKLTFIDSRIFDVELFKYLEANKEVVEINVSGRIALSSIPPRLDRWISKAAEGGGKVEILPMPATRLFIFSLISMAFSSLGIWEKFREENAYDQAKKYDVKIFYKKEPAGDTIIEKIVMTKRKK